jgi:hypothetical protein
VLLSNRRPTINSRLSIAGNERAFLTWFYEGATAKPGVIGPDAVDEYLRTFAGREGVLGSMGIYRAAFTSIETDRASHDGQDDGTRRGNWRRGGWPGRRDGEVGRRTAEFPS